MMIQCPKMNEEAQTDQPREVARNTLTEDIH
jgi:hypothetical protein